MVISDTLKKNEDECNNCQASCPVVKHVRNVTGTKLQKQFCLDPESFGLWQRLSQTPPPQGIINFQAPSFL
jgi:hypothetical protein